QISLGSSEVAAGARTSSSTTTTSSLFRAFDFGRQHTAIVHMFDSPTKKKKNSAGGQITVMDSAVMSFFPSAVQAPTLRSDESVLDVLMPNPALLLTLTTRGLYRNDQLLRATSRLARPARHS